MSPELELVMTDELLQEHEKRVVAEYKELADRLKKLIEFLSTKTFADLAQEDRDLLVEQGKHMNEYIRVLKLRIERFTLVITA